MASLTLMVNSFLAGSAEDASCKSVEEGGAMSLCGMCAACPNTADYACSQGKGYYARGEGCNPTSMPASYYATAPQSRLPHDPKAVERCPASRKATYYCAEACQTTSCPDGGSALATISLDSQAMMSAFLAGQLHDEDDNDGEINACLACAGCDSDGTAACRWGAAGSVYDTTGSCASMWGSWGFASPPPAASANNTYAQVEGCDGYATAAAAPADSDSGAWLKYGGGFASMRLLLLGNVLLFVYHAVAQ
jgi:hypothetical protein